MSSKQNSSPKTSYKKVEVLRPIACLRQVNLIDYINNPF